jgi:flagellar secretion chaperone FliS
MQKAVQAYFETQVTTTSQGELLIMLYDGAIKFLVQSKAKIKEKDYAGKGILLSKAIDVISELDASLNPQKGGDLADNLHKLYFYCNTRLLNANLKLDITYVDEVIKILSGLREAYRQIMQMNTAAAQAPAAGEDASSTTGQDIPADGTAASGTTAQAKTTPFPAQGKAPAAATQPVAMTPAATTPTPYPSYAGKTVAPAVVRPGAPTTPGGPGPARPQPPVQYQGQPQVQPQVQPKSQGQPLAKITPLQVPAKTVPAKTPAAAPQPVVEKYAAPPRPQLVRPMATRHAAYQTAAATGESSGEPSAKSGNATSVEKPQTNPPAPSPAPQKQTQAASPAPQAPPVSLTQPKGAPEKAPEVEPKAPTPVQGKRLAGAAAYSKTFTDT